jgi:uncharacterized membrane protein YdjX (TVP38/TMEM64 family)
MAVLPVGLGLEALRDFIASSGNWGAAIFVLVYIVCTILLIPGSALTLAAGVLFEPLLGLGLIILGSNIGAFLAWILARTLLQKRVQNWANAKPKLSQLSQSISENGLKVVLLLRLSPLFPFTLLNYFLGLTNVPVWQILFGNFVGMLPGTVAFVYLGTLPSAVAEAQSSNVHPLKIGLQLAGLIATLLVTWLITRWARGTLSTRVDTDV